MFDINVIVFQISISNILSIKINFQILFDLSESILIDFT